MPTRLSSYYNDPALGQGFESLAKAFAPMDGTEMLAGEKAKATKESASRLAEYFAAAKNPAVTRQQLDNLGIGAGAFTPKDSFTAVDLNNATTRDTNAADNTRALQQTRLQQEGETSRSLLAPVSQDQVRFVPGAIARLYGVDERQYGPASLQPGETVVRPDGSRLEGAAKPLSSDELKAKIVGGLPAGEQRAFGLGGIPTVNVTGQDGRPVVAFGPDAVGQQPAPAAVAPSNVSRLQAERAALPAGDPRAAELTSAIEAEGRGAVADPYRSSTDQALAARHAEIVKAGATADNMSTNLDRLEALLQDVPTGALAERKLQVARYAQDLGLGEVANSLTGGKLDEAQAANAIVQRLAPGLRVPGSGAQSDRELQNFLASLPSLQNTPGGNRIVISTLRQAAQQQRQAAEIARQAQAGTIDKFEAERRIAALASPFAQFADADGTAVPSAGGRGAPAPAVTPAGATAKPVRVSTPEEARRLPRGTPIQLPDGTVGRVP